MCDDDAYHDDNDYNDADGDDHDDDYDDLNVTQYVGQLLLNAGCIAMDLKSATPALQP